MPSRPRSSRPDAMAVDTSWATRERNRRKRLPSGKIERARRGRGRARAHRRAQSDAQCLHRCHRRARARQRATRSTPRAKKQKLGAARRRAVRGEEPVRHRRAATVAGSKINRAHPPAETRFAADRAAGSGRRGARRRAQHGRIRLRLHRRERARRPFAQSARYDAHDRRLVGRLAAARWPAAWCRWRSAPTPMARSACRRRCAAFSG